SLTAILSKDTRKDIRVARTTQLQRPSFQFCTCITDEHLEMAYMYPIKKFKNKLSIYSIEVTKDVLGKVYKTKWNDGWNDKKHWKRLR
ncbi:19669_t:CDS:2, partial [Rhizophagus irregularis]